MNDGLAPLTDNDAHAPGAGGPGRATRSSALLRRRGAERGHGLLRGHHRPHALARPRRGCCPLDARHPGRPRRQHRHLRHRAGREPALVRRRAAGGGGPHRASRCSGWRSSSRSSIRSRRLVAADRGGRRRARSPTPTPSSTWRSARSSCPSRRWAARVITALVPEEERGDNPYRTRYLDDRFLDQPALAIGQATREALAHGRRRPGHAAGRDGRAPHRQPGAAGGRGAARRPARLPRARDQALHLAARAGDHEPRTWPRRRSP